MGKQKRRATSYPLLGRTLDEGTVDVGPQFTAVSYLKEEAGKVARSLGNRYVGAALFVAIVGGVGYFWLNRTAPEPSADHYEALRKAVDASPSKPIYTIEEQEFKL